MRRLFTGAALLGCGHKPWLEDSCSADARGPAEAVVAIEAHAVALHPVAGAPVRVDTDACLHAEARGVVALGDGRRALAWSYETSGGNWIESASVSDQHACLVDFTTRRATPMATEALGRDFRHLRVAAGPTSGWLYLDEIVGPLRVLDVERGRASAIDIKAEGGERVAIAEYGATIRMVGTRYEALTPDHPIYRHYLVIADFDANTWPPRERSRREVEVRGRPDLRVLSADGRWLAYSGLPYFAGIELEGQASDIGLVDLERGAVSYEALRQPVHATVAELVIAGGRPWLLRITSNRESNSPAHDLAWFDDHGAQVGPAVHRATLQRAYAARWLPVAGRVLIDDGCSVDLIDLPPPGP